MKYLLVIPKLVVSLSLLFMGTNVLAAPIVEAHAIHYTLQPKSGTSFNRVEQLSIVVFANKLAKEFRSPYTLVYRIIDKEGNVSDGKVENFLFSMCNDTMAPVKTVGTCDGYNNVATIQLKRRQTRKPPSIKGYIKVGRFWIKEAEVANFPRFEEMEYKLDSFKLTDKSGRIVNL